MITDRSGNPHVGLALLRANLAKLTPPATVEIKYEGEQQVLVVTSQGEPPEVFHSVSFHWNDEGLSSELVTAFELLGVQPPSKVL